MLEESRWQAYVALQKEVVRIERHARHVAHKAFRSIEKHKHKQENRRERKKDDSLNTKQNLHKWHRAIARESLV